MSQQPQVLQNLKWNEWIIVVSVIIPIQSHTLNSAVSWLERITFSQMFFLGRSANIQYNILLIRVHSKGKHHKCWDSTKISFATQLLVQHLDLLMRFSLNVLTPSSHSTSTTLHLAASCMPPYLIVWYHTPFLTWHSLIAWLPILSSPLNSGFCHAASATSPLFLSHWDSAWHANNARFLAPNIGERRIRKPTSVFYLTVIPPYSVDHHGTTPTCNGYFLCLCLPNSQFVQQHS